MVKLIMKLKTEFSFSFFWKIFCNFSFFFVLLTLWNLSNQDVKYTPHIRDMCYIAHLWSFRHKRRDAQAIACLLCWSLFQSQSNTFPKTKTIFFIKPALRLVKISKKSLPYFVVWNLLSYHKLANKKTIIFPQEKPFKNFKNMVIGTAPPTVPPTYSQCDG